MPTRATGRRAPGLPVPAAGLCAGLALLCLLAGCRTAASAARRRTRLLMGTYVTITARAPAAVADPAVEKAFARLDTISRRFNYRDSASPLRAFNDRDEPFADPEIAALLRLAAEVSAATDGAFDVTAQPLVALWGFASGEPALPAPAAVESTLGLVGWQNLRLAGDSVAKLIPGLRLDLGGIAKGYAIGEAARVLRAAGVESALVDAGGDIYALGRNQGRAWRVGVRHPRGEGIVAVIPASDLAVVTSGDYEQAFTARGDSSYCHIIDPRTGRPARGLAAVTVVSPDPARADAWATALFVLGPDALGLAEAADGIEALFITPDLEMSFTSGLAEILELPAPADRAP